MKYIDVVFVVLHYNTIDETIKCVDSIKKMNNSKNIKIIIVDNKSPNDTGEKLKIDYEKDEYVDVVLTPKNGGFSYGNNYGYTYMKKNYNTKFAVFCNNDIIFIDKDFITKIEKTYDNEKFYVLGPDIYNPNNKQHQSPIPTINSKLWRVNITILLNTIALKLYNIYWVLISLIFKSKKVITKKDDIELQNTTKLKKKSNVPMMGACLVFSKDFIDEKQKVFEPETFMYYEEYLLNHWCQKNNKNTIFEPDILVYHNDGIATNSIKDSRKNKNKFRMEKILESAKIYRKVLKNSKREKYEKSR